MVYVNMLRNLAPAGIIEQGKTNDCFYGVLMEVNKLKRRMRKEKEMKKSRRSK